MMYMSSIQQLELCCASFSLPVEIPLSRVARSVSNCPAESTGLAASFSSKHAMAAEDASWIGEAGGEGATSGSHTWVARPPS